MTDSNHDIMPNGMNVVIDNPSHTPTRGAVPYRYIALKDNQATVVEGGVIEEVLVSLYVNGQELVTLMCSPLQQTALAVGFLFNEGMIDGIQQIRLVQANVTQTTIDVFLDHSDFTPPRRLTLTSGCGGGLTFRDMAIEYPAVESDLVTTPDVLTARMHDLHGRAALYQQVRGVHTSVLADQHTVLVSAEDVGRHNTIDKLAGEALLRGIAMRDRILLVSGRISSEMLSKARQMGVPIVASRTSPTSIAIELAQAWGITVVGYLRRDSMRVYTHAHRLGL